MIGAFCEAVDKIIALQPDLCIYSGDLFHSVRPLNSIIARAGEQFYRLAEEKGIPTVLIAGNHDAPKQPHIGAAVDIFRQIDNLYIASRGELEIFELTGRRIFALPHCLTTADLAREIEKINLESDLSDDILVAHGVAAGMPEFSMADLKEQELPLTLLDRFGYAALGHFHNFCQVSKHAWYAGSTERLSQSERTSEKGFAVVEFDPLRVKFECVTSRTMLDLPQIDASQKRGDELATLLIDTVEAAKAENRIVRLNVTGVSDEALKTIPAAVITELKEKSFDLNIRFTRESADEDAPQFGKTSFAHIEQGFLDFLLSANLSGYDKDRLRKEAVRYLRELSDQSA